MPRSAIFNITRQLALHVTRAINLILNYNRPLRIGFVDNLYVNLTIFSNSLNRIIKGQGI